MNISFLWKCFFNLLLVQSSSSREMYQSYSRWRPSNRSNLVDVFNNLVHQLDIFNMLDIFNLLGPPDNDTDPTWMPERPMAKLPQVRRSPNNSQTMQARRSPSSLDHWYPSIQTNPTNNIVVHIVQGPKASDSALPATTTTTTTTTTTATTTTTTTTVTSLTKVSPRHPETVMYDPTADTFSSRNLRGR